VDNCLFSGANCNDTIDAGAIGAIGVRAPPTVHNELELEIAPKSETWTRKFNSGGAIAYGYAAICPIATGHGGIPKHTGDGQHPSIQNDSGCPENLRVMRAFLTLR
jgi:hypothetical protein